jgi:hypothetical protein
MRIGFIQSRGLGDIIIAAPIAQHWIRQGHEIYWPIDHEFYDYVTLALPEIRFIRMPESLCEDRRHQSYYFDGPLHMLQSLPCDRVVSLYSALAGLPVTNEPLARSLKFDEYKYAICGLPFALKYTLKLKRDKAREEALFNRLNLPSRFALVHQDGWSMRKNIEVPPPYNVDKIVHIEALTDNPFDWLLTIEKASSLHFIDSGFANIVEQLQLPQPKFLHLRSLVEFTPVYANWTIIGRSDLERKR